jgi:serine/threonine protein phosphatase PrpC
VGDLYLKAPQYSFYPFAHGCPYLCPAGEPQVSCRELAPGDRYLILACDGVWDVFSDQEAADLLMERFSCEGPFTDAAKYLVSTVTDSSLTGLLAKCPSTAY